jgi:hypothetical protein
VPKFDWQLLVALLAVAGSAGYLARAGWKMLRSRKKSGAPCESCHSCAGPSKASGPPSTLVPLETFAQSEKKNDGGCGRRSLRFSAHAAIQPAAS